METEIKIPNAEKWTEKEVKENLNCIYCWINQSEQNIYMGKALWRLGLYPDIWAYWKRKFAGHDELMEEMAQIEYILECRLAEAALYKEVSAPMAMFILRCKYGWKDKTKETAKPQETAKPVECNPDSAPDAPAKAGSAAIEEMSHQLSTLIRLLPRIDGREEERKPLIPLSRKVEKLMATG